MLRYRLIFEARVRETTVGRLLSVALAIAICFLGTITTTQLLAFCYAPILLGFSWLFQDRRRGRSLSEVEESIVKINVQRGVDVESYVRSRYRESLRPFHIIRVEPILWSSVLVLMALLRIAPLLKAH